ncbi:MAG: galactokinase [Bacteroidota bacterium]|nr:galactokinase [Bacteroidota bacterium]
MKQEKLVVLSPGRINLIGEHIDYNGGFVLPGATHLNIKLEFSESEKDYSEIDSKTIDKSIRLDLNNLERSDIKWENYIIGSLIQLLKIRNTNIKNFICVIDGDLPVGAGISSSSSLICGFIKGIGIMNKLDLTDKEILKTSREVEYDFIGVKGGIMDQSSIIYGKENKLIFLNCKTKTFEYINIDLGEYKILLLDTNIKHDLLDSSYNDRVRECKKALDIINNENNNYDFLTEVNLEDLETYRSIMTKNIYNRAFFVVEENQRTIMAVEKLKDLDMNGFGDLMYASHFGLKKLYEVSCKELDFLVDQTIDNENILGARMMGGGFGGCTINIIHSEEIEDFTSFISEKYLKRFSKNLTPIITSIGNGLNYDIIR